MMIAMALACSPQVLIADEPTTALDVTIQAQILDLLQELQDRLGTAIILVTHDLGVVADFADRKSAFRANLDQLRFKPHRILRQAFDVHVESHVAPQQQTFAHY